MKADDLEELNASEELRVRDDYRAALQIFRYEVTLKDGTMWLANKVDVEVYQAGSAAYFEVTMEDCWSYDRQRQIRTLRKVRVLTFEEVTIEDWAQA